MTSTIDDAPLKTEQESEETNRVAPIAEALNLGLIEDDETPPGTDEDESPITVKRRRGRPRKDESVPRTTKRQPLPQWRNGAIAAFVTQIYSMGGAALSSSKNERQQQYGQCALVIAEPAGVVWEKLAKRHETLRRIFDKMMQGSEMTELMMVHAPLFVMMLSDMGLLRTANLAKEFDDEMENLNDD